MINKRFSKILCICFCSALILMGCSSTQNNNAVNNIKDLDNDVLTDGINQNSNNALVEEINETSDETNDTATSHDESSVVLEEIEVFFDVIYDQQVDVDQYKNMSIKIGAEQDYNQLIVQLTDTDQNMLYLTPEKERSFEASGIEIMSLDVEDVNGDNKKDIILIYNSYPGSGYLGGLEYERAYVLLQTEDSEVPFTFDINQHEVANTRLVNTDLSHVQFYYQTHNWDNDLYTYSIDHEKVVNEYVDASVDKPVVVSDDAAFASHTNDLIQSQIYEIQAMFMEVQDFLTYELQSQVMRSDRYLSVRFDLDWYIEGAAYPNSQVYTLNIDLETGQILTIFDMMVIDKERLTSMLDLCDHLKYAGINESSLNEEIKTQIIENRGYLNAYMDHERLYMSIPTIHATGDYLIFSFDLELIKDYFIVEMAF